MGVKNSIPKVLLVEDNPKDAKLVKRSLNGEFQMVCVDSLKEAEAQLGKEDFEIILLDLTLPDSDGLPTLGKVREMAPDVPIVVITAAEDREMASGRSGRELRITFSRERLMLCCCKAHCAMGSNGKKF